MEDATKLTKVEKLRVAGVLAPAVRRGSSRKVKIVGKDGAVIREATLDEVQAGIAKRQELEFSVRDDAPQTVCAGWDGKCPKASRPGKWAFKPRMVARRMGGAWVCKSCSNRRNQASMTPEQRSRNQCKAREALAALTPEYRSAAARKANASRTAEQRSDISRKRGAKLTPEQRSNAARKAWIKKRKSSERVSGEE